MKQQYFLRLVLVFLLFARLFNTHAQVRAQDSLALVALYNSTNGPGWINHTGWLAGGPVTTWYGVTIDNYGLGLNLSNNGLTGTIPSQLGNILSLVVLDLSYNKLSGSIPAELGYLANLKLLTLANNQLAGSIPNGLGNLTSLEYLSLQYNHLSGIIPDQLGNLSNLATLLLSHNQLGGAIPANLVRLTKLSDLFIDHNYFSFAGMEFIIQFGSPNLIDTPQHTIALHATNHILSVSAGGKLANNTYRWYKGAKLIKTSPGDSTFMPIDSGRYSVEVTNSIVTPYTRLTLYSDSVNMPGLALTPALRDSLILVALYDSTNGPGWSHQNGWLTGPVKSWYGITVNSGGRITGISLHFNKLSGNIPTQLAGLDSLQTLDFSENLLSGSIPAQLGSLTKLQTLQLNDNHLSGNIPAQLSSLASLQALYLSSNQLSGSIPPELGSLANLQILWLFNNQLSGSIPAELGNLSSLQILYIGSNQLNGKIPGQLGNLSSLLELDLSNNQLSGSIPGELGNLANLQSLTLNNNQFSGNMPVALANLANLTYLNLQHNQISGSIPARLGYLANLGWLDMSYNQLSGNIPVEFGGLSSLSALLLNNNQLTGGLPAQLSYPVSMSMIDVSYNKLSGSISPDLANARLNTLNLVGNYFNFDGIELMVQTFGLAVEASPQNTLPLHLNNNTLSISAGGTLGNNIYEWYNGNTLVETVYGDSTYTPVADGKYSVVVTNSVVTDLIGLRLYSGNSIIIRADSAIMPARPSKELASYEYTGTDGWTHYYYDNHTPNDITDDTLLLSLKKNGQDIGTIGDGTFAVKVVATPGAGSNSGIKLTNPLITNPTGYWVMNRYWQVTPTHEPTGDVGVRFYYNNQDLKDVNGSYPTHNLTNNNIIFYKTVGGNPDPTSNLAGATRIISIMPGTVASDTTWIYHALSDTTQYGEYIVSSFSGGGGGGTGNHSALPVVLVNFKASRDKSNIKLHWQSEQEVNAANYTIERSLAGVGFTAVGIVGAAGNSSVPQSYSFEDYNAALINTTALYYRLVITDKDGRKAHSGAIKINMDGGTGKMFIVYPNPAKNTASIVFTARVPGKYAVEIQSISGKIIKRIEGIAAIGVNNITTNVSSLASGIYIITISGDNITRQSMKLVRD